MTMYGAVGIRWTEESYQSSGGLHPLISSHATWFMPPQTEAGLHITMTERG